MLKKAVNSPRALVISHHDPAAHRGLHSLVGSALTVPLIGYLARQMTFNLFGRVVIGGLWEATAQKCNKKYHREDNSEGQTSNYVASDTLKTTNLFPRCR